MESKDASDHREASFSDASDSYIVEPTMSENATISEQTRLLEDASFVNPPEPTVTPSSTLGTMKSQGRPDPDASKSTVVDSTTSSLPPFIENMLSDATSDSISSDSNVPDSIVRENTTASAMLDNAKSKNTPQTSSSESDSPDDTTVTPEQLPSLKNLEIRDASKSNLTGNSMTPLEQRLPSVDRMESKNPPYPYVADISTSEPNVTGPEAPKLKDASDQEASNTDAAKSDTSPSNSMAPTTSNSKASDPTSTYVKNDLRMTQEYIEQRRQVRRRVHQRWDREREYRIIASGLGYDLSDQQLREILYIPPSERDEFGKIINMEYVFQWVPREHQGLPIDDKHAQNILHNATEKALYMRLLPHNNSIRTWTSVSTDGKCFNLIAHWYGKRPQLPDSLKDIPAIWLYDLRGYVEQHREIGQWVRDENNRRRQYRSMVQDLGNRLSDEQIREIPEIPESERNEHGNITNMDHVFRFVPREHEGPIDDKSAVDILRAAIDIAVYKNLSQTNSTNSPDDKFAKDGDNSTSAHCPDKKPELPDSLKDVSALIVFDEERINPDELRHDCGWRCRVGQPHVHPSQRDYV